MNNSTMIRLFAFSALLALAAAQSCAGNCGAVKLEKKVASCSSPPPRASAPAFAQSDYRFTCVGDAGKACDAPENAVVPNNSTLACCGCYLYAEFCAGKPGPFVTDHSFKSHDHLKLMPAAPCTGVENWGSTACGGESIWDAGATVLNDGNKGGGWGMAINPVSRRGQHQMHVHLANVHGNLMSVIVKAANRTKSTSYISCSGKQTTACKLQDPTYTGDRTKEIQVHIFTSKASPSAANPFRVAYGSNPADAANKAMTLHASTLVVKVPGVKSGDSWAVVTNPTGPAECFFTSTEEQCKQT